VRYQYRYTKDEKRHLAAANRVIDNPAASPVEINKALRHVQRIQEAAEARAFDLAITQDEPDPTVDDLVAALEKAPPVAAVPIPASPLQAAQDIADGKKPAAVPVPEPPVRTCQMSGCELAGQETWDGRTLCPAHFASEAGRFASETAAQDRARRTAMYRNVLAQRGEDPNINDIGALLRQAMTRPIFRDDRCRQWHDLY
jgi:hypothetical protein